MKSLLVTPAVRRGTGHVSLPSAASPRRLRGNGVLPLSLLVAPAVRRGTSRLPPAGPPPHGGGYEGAPRRRGTTPPATRPLAALLLVASAFAATLAAGAAPRREAPGVPTLKELHRDFGDADLAAFRAPPATFRPETWFHFIGGNVATQGITADLEAIAGAGLSGIQLFHGQFGGPWPGVEPQIRCLSPAWDGAVRHVANECARLGLRFTMQNCPGWAMAGGPWIPPEKAMRHLVWSRTDIAGGSNVTVALPLPQPSGEAWRDYRDVAVSAFPTPADDTDKALAPVSVKSNREGLPWAACIGGASGGKITLEPDVEPTWVEAAFQDAVTLRTVQLPPVQKLNHGWCYDPGVTVTVAAVLPEGLREVARAELPPSNWQDNKPISLACAEAPARAYRITLAHKHSLVLTSLRLFAGARQNNWEAEAGWTLRGLDRRAYPGQSAAAWVSPAGITDLTAKLDAQGTLAWAAPAGAWSVLRVGHVNTGKRNGPAPAEATGWECDKLAATGAETHFAGYIGRLSGKGGPVGGGLLKGMLMDSWECETQTWTPGLDAQFLGLRGYALTPWLPALMGYVVGDPATTARFLRDWRATVNELLVQRFFGRMAELGHANGLTVSFETASGDVFPADILEYYKHADVPMCEFWQPRSDSYVGSLDFKPIKPCASAARLYGKPRVAAEAFTSFALTWNEHFDMLKDVANIHFAEGVTHLVFHTYTHNPRTDFLPPGTSFGSGIGTPFLRGQTWWPHMPAFVAYLSRCGYLLERGRPVSDVLWYLGDELAHKPPQDAPFPAGFKYDYCNLDVLLHRLSVRDGLLETPEGVRYRVLWLRDNPRMLPETVEKLLDLAQKGASVVGDPPREIATLSGGEKAERRFQAAVRALWGDARAAGVRRVGRGRVLAGVPLDAALPQLGLEPDVTGTGVRWSHRQADNADWYFLAAPAAHGFHGALGFRSSGAVTLWDPVTGATVPASVTRREGTHTRVALDLPPAGSVFVVFSGPGPREPAVVRVERDGVAVCDVTRAATNAGPRVVAASYGDPHDPARRRDVADLVRAALARGETTVTPNNGWAGGDPALRTRKQLFVTLAAPDGAREQKLAAWENEPLQLVADETAALPVCAVEAGGARLVAWEPGSYRVSRADGTTAVCAATLPRRLALATPWTLAFPPGWDAPAALQLPALRSWTELELPPPARAFSGTATYTTRFTLDAAGPDARVELDLGRVEAFATVKVNGRLLAPLWAPPYRLDITDAVRPGANEVAVAVTSTWFNRLAYDAGRPEAERKTWTISGPGANAPLKPAGLLGPVTLRIGQCLDIRRRP